MGTAPAAELAEQQGRTQLSFPTTETHSEPRRVWVRGSSSARPQLPDQAGEGPEPPSGLLIDGSQGRAGQRGPHPDPGIMAQGPHCPQALLSGSLGTQEAEEGGTLTAFSGRSSLPPSFHGTTGFVQTGDSGCPRPGAREGVAGWGGALFPDGSSPASDWDLFTPAMPPTGTRHTGSGGPAQPHALPLKVRAPHLAALKVGCPAPGLELGEGGGRQLLLAGGPDSQLGLASPRPSPPPHRVPDLGSGRRDFSFSTKWE